MKNINVQITLDTDAVEIINKEIKQQITNYVQRELILCDLAELERLCSMKRDTLEELFLNDPRVKLHERRRGPRGKRYWLYKPTIEAIEYIVIHEWE